MTDGFAGGISLLKDLILGPCGFSPAGFAAIALDVPNTMPHGLSGDGRCELVWRQDGSGLIAGWNQNSTATGQSGIVGSLGAAWDFLAAYNRNRESKADLLWRDPNTSITVEWPMNGATIAGGTAVGALDASWTVQGIGDYNGDGRADIMWRNSGGLVFD